MIKISAQKSHKTPQLMKLLTGSQGPANPILDEDFKAEIIRAKKNPEPVKPIQTADGSAQINITSELITQWLPKVMLRFNVCTCDRCCAEATVTAFDEIRPVIVRVRNDGDLKRAARLKADRQQSVLMQLIRIVTARKKLPRHDI